MAAKTEPIESQSAGAPASDDTLHKFDKVWRALNDLQPTSDPVENLHGSDDQLSKQFGDLRRPSPQQEPAEDWYDVLSGISHHLNNGTSERRAIYDRLVTMEKEMKRRGSRGFARYFVAILIGVAATLVWQSYSDAAKQVIATSAPEFGWSPEVKQKIVGWVQQLGWTKPPADPEIAAAQAAPVVQTASEKVTPKAPDTPSIDPEQVQQMARDLATLRQTVEQLAAGQDQVTHEIDKLEAADVEILAKVTPVPPPPRPIAATARKLTPVGPPTAQAPIPTHLPPHP
jgi:hypothetical protein